jgi:hypothetical protein
MFCETRIFTDFMGHLHKETSAGRGIKYVLSNPSWLGRMMTTARGWESARKNPRICGVPIVFGKSVQS